MCYSLTMLTVRGIIPPSVKTNASTYRFLPHKAYARMAEKASEDQNTQVPEAPLKYFEGRKRITRANAPTQRVQILARENGMNCGSTAKEGVEMR